ncbi:BURP domain protein RD22-like [Spinacia oleracea]|uniref:BURP domain protein RD22-like n=1 Tax=Spinacia oleracea TaxID=3562 RepID=A0ABM3QPS2_SPIOL|nr:BURP domain protein RD22-like [Spinacia oleracea]
MASFLLACFFILLITVLNVPSLGQAKSDYWQENLPNTVMPYAVETALPSTNTTENSIWVNTDEVIIQNYAGVSGHCHDDKIIEFLKSRFVLPKTLQVGSQISIQLKTIVGITTKFPTEKHLPQFNSKNLAQNLKYFSINSNSEEAFVMNLTINKCENSNPINGKWQFCATSLRDLLTFTNATLGLKRLAAISPPSPSASGILRYKVTKVESLVGAESELLLCHRYGFPYAVFYCHQPAATKAFSVHLAAEREDGLEAIAVCHMETSKWSASYIGFKALGVKPGTPICHFLHSRDLLMYANN